MIATHIHFVRLDNPDIVRKKCAKVEVGAVGSMGKRFQRGSGSKGVLTSSTSQSIASPSVFHSPFDQPNKQTTMAMNNMMLAQLMKDMQVRHRQRERRIPTRRFVLPESAADSRQSYSFFVILVGLCLTFLILSWLLLENLLL